MRLLWALVLLPAAWSQSEGLTPRWEIEAAAVELAENVETIQKILEQVRPKEWIQDGAPDVYLSQYDEVLKDVDYLGRSANALERFPARLSVVVDTFLWLDRSHSMVGSLGEGVRKYQNSAIADLLDSARSRNDGVMDKLKDYMRQLAVHTEAEWNVANDEAQRCRAELMSKPK